MQTSSDEAIREDLMARIRERGSVSVKIKTLLGQCGYDAEQRVRQSSLAAAQARLKAWGIFMSFPGGLASNDWVTLSLRPARPVAPATVSVVRPGALAPPARSAAQRAELPELPTVDVCADPLSFAFEIQDARPGEDVRDVYDALWARQPVFLVVKASEELFALVAATMTAFVRRRSSCMPSSRRSMPGSGSPPRRRGARSAPTAAALAGTPGGTRTLVRRRRSRRWRAVGAARASSGSSWPPSRVRSASARRPPNRRRWPRRPQCRFRRRRRCRRRPRSGPPPGGRDGPIPVPRPASGRPGTRAS